MSVRAILVAALIVPNGALAECWEYKIVDTTAADALVAKASARAVSSSQLLASLNALGRQGWELASQPTVSVFERSRDEDSPKGKDWISRLNPPVTLFKRPSSECAKQ